MESNLSTGLTSCFSPPASPPISVCNCFPSYADDSVMRAVRTSTVIRESRKEKASIENCSCCKPVSDSSIVKNCAGVIVVQMFNDKDNVRGWCCTFAKYPSKKLKIWSVVLQPDCSSATLGSAWGFNISNITFWRTLLVWLIKAISF